MIRILHPVITVLHMFTAFKVSMTMPYHIIESRLSGTKHTRTHMRIWVMLSFKKKYDEALKMLDKALQIHPECGEAYLSYANYYAYVLKDWKQTEVSVNKAIQYGQ